MKPIAFAIAVLATLPGASNAQELPRPVRVSHADLDLTTRAGVKKLDGRIAAAARALCPDTSGTYELARLVIAHRCAAQITNAAKPQRDQTVAASARRELAARAH